MNKNYTKLNQNDSAVINRLIVFNLVKNFKEITRVEIAEKTGLQTSTITYIIQDLKKANLVMEKEVKKENENGKGNKPFIVKLNYESNYLIGIDLKKDSLSLICMSIDNKIFARKTYRISFNHPSSLVDKIVKIINNIKSKYTNKKLLGVGIGIPGVVDPYKSEIVISNVLNIKKLIIDNDITDRIGAPIFVENDANVSAYGEYFLHYRNIYNYLFFIYFRLNKIGEIQNTGIGSGIVINGEIYHGEMFAAGEIGDIVFNAARGILVEDTSFDFRVELIKLLHQAEIEKSPESQRIVSNFGLKIGETIADTINIINPGIVVIGGDYPIEYGGFFDSILNGIEKDLLSFFRGKLPIRKSFLGNDCVSIGAATIAEKNIFSPKYFSSIMNKI